MNRNARKIQWSRDARPPPLCAVIFVFQAPAAVPSLCRHFSLPFL